MENEMLFSRQMISN